MLKKFEYGGKEGKEAAAFAISELTASKDFVARRYAIAALQTLGPEIRPYLDGYAAALKDEDAGVRFHVAMAFGGVGPAAAPYAPAIAASLKDADPGVRYWCMVALGGLGEAAAAHSDALFEALRDADAHVRVAAAKTIRQVRPGDVPRVVELLTASLFDRDEEPVFRASSVESLQALGDALSTGAEAPQCAALGHALSDGYARVREVAAAALADLGPAAVLPHSLALAALAQGDRDEDVRGAASRALQSLDAAASLQAEDPVLRFWAASTIASKGGAAVTPHAAIFAEMLTTEADGALRHQAALALGASREAAAEYPGALGAALGDAEGRVRVAAMRALADSRPDSIPDAVEVLVEALASEGAAGRASAAEALFFAGLALKPHAEALVAAMKDEEFAVRVAAIRALEQGGRTCVRGAGAEIARLAKQDPDIDVRRAAVATLREYRLDVMFGLAS